MRGAVAVSLVWALAQSPPAVFAKAAEPSAHQTMCRRAPDPIVLPAEKELPPPPVQAGIEERSAAMAVDAPPSPIPAPPPPPPPPMSVPAEGGDSIVVTGSRAPGSGVSAEDVGSLPDRSVAESVARVPGVGVTPEASDDRGSAFTHRDHREPAPAPGLLTAGDHDDLLNPALYARYVDGFLSHEALAGVPRVDTERVLTFMVQDTAGRPVPFASVTITCSDGNTLSLSTTANGEAVFFPELDRLGSQISVTAGRDRVASSRRALTISPRDHANRQTIRIDAAAAPVRNFDLALVVDTTGSMGDELEYLKAELGDILAKLNSDHPNLNIRVALVAYRDQGDQYITRTFPFTQNVAALQADLAQQSAGGGGDYPEAVEQALARAVALDWRQDAVKSLLFVADAPPHADDVVTAWTSTEVARAKRIQIVPVGASGVGPGAEYFMRASAALTQSRYIFLTDDSGIGNPHAPPSVDCYLVTALGPLIRRVLDAQISGHRVEPAENEIIRSVGHYNNGRCLSQ
ncbi:MAG: VWA domain-containing protein [Pseudomonadota bacterium]